MLKDDENQKKEICVQFSEEHMCMFFFSPQAFELATGDYLFEPHSGDDYSRDEG